MAIRQAGVQGSSAVFAALLGLAAVVRVGVVLNRSLDADESQHLHAAWLVGQGQVPFRDFWEHHLPLFYYLLAPLTRWFAESPAVYLVGRGVMTVGAGLALLLTYRLARRLSREAAAVAVVLLAFLPEFVQNSTEVRPDVPALVAWLVTLVALVTWRERGAAGWLWVAGLALGLALAFTLKAIYAALGAALAVCFAGLGREAGGLGRTVTWLARFAAGASVPLVGILAWLWLSGGSPALTGFVQQVIVQNLRFVDFMKAWPVSTDGAGFLLLALLGIALAARRPGARVLRDAVHGTLLLPLVVISVALLLPSTPAVYQHAWLPVLPIAALYAGLALATLLDRARASRGGGRMALAVLALVGGLVVPGGQSVYDALRDHTSNQFRVMRLMLMHACPGEAVLDGTALYVFRPSAYRYGVLMTGVREWIARGMIPEEQIEDDLREARARVAYPDRRLRGLIGPVEAFLKRHYVSTPDGLLIAGVTIPVSGRPGDGRTSIDLLVSGPYRFTADPGIEVAVDRVGLRRGWVELGPGRHEVTWSGPQGAIGLVATTCPERRALAGASNRLTVP